MRKGWIFLASLALAVFSAGICWGAGIEERIMKDWTRSEKYSDRDMAQVLEMKITYYSAEYVEALIMAEAEKNMWTQDEMERYKYNLLKTLNLEEYIAFHVDLNVQGPPIYPSPFDRFITLRIGKNTYTPVDYDKRMNFKLSGKRDGLVWFRRYDEKTNKNLLEKAKEVRIIMNSAMASATQGKPDPLFVWNITKDNPAALTQGRAAERLELDRLLRRAEKLTGDRNALMKQVDVIDNELKELNDRINELQR